MFQRICKWAAPYVRKVFAAMAVAAVMAMAKIGAGALAAVIDPKPATA